MMKCKEYLAFINADTGKIKHRFELTFDSTDCIEGRRPQLIKKLLTLALKERWINGRQLFGYLKKTHGITGKDMLAWAFGEDPTNQNKRKSD